MMNKKILPENLFLESTKKENQSDLTNDKNFLFTNKNEIRFFTAITLPLILAACGGGGGGGAVSPTPDAGSGGSGSGGSGSGGSGSGGSGTAGTQANA